MVRDARWTDEGLIALGTLGLGGPLFLYDVDQQSSRLLIHAGAGTVSCAGLAADGHHVVAGTVDGRLWCIDRDASAPPRKLVESPQTVFTATAITDDARLIAAGTFVGSIYLCDLSAGTTHVLFPDRESSVADLHFSSDRKSLASTHNDGSIRLWDSTAGTALPDFAHHDGPARAAGFLPDGERFILAGLDDSIRIWDLARREEARREEARTPGVTAIAMSPDGSTVAWAGHDHVIVVWNLDRHETELEIDSPLSYVRQLTFSPDGSIILADEGRDSVYRYDLRRQGEESQISVVLPVSIGNP